VTRSILPDLKSFSFNGASEYLDDLVAQIDAPRLDHLFITFPLDEMNLDSPHLVQFISRTPRFQEPNEAHVTLDLNAEVKLLWASDDHARLRVEILYGDFDTDLQPSFIAQVYTMCLPPLPTVENLRLGLGLGLGLGVFAEDLYSDLDWTDNVESDEWLELLRPFTAVKSLYLCKEFQPDIASALQELVGGRTTEILPSLQNIFLANFEPSGPFREAIGWAVHCRPAAFRSSYSRFVLRDDLGTSLHAFS
jgi:hypothetical protein